MRCRTLLILTIMLALAGCNTSGVLIPAGNLDSGSASFVEKDSIPPAEEINGPSAAPSGGIMIGSGT